MANHRKHRVAYAALACIAYGVIAGHIEPQNTVLYAVAPLTLIAFAGVGALFHKRGHEPVAFLLLTMGLIFSACQYAAAFVVPLSTMLPGA